MVREPGNATQLTYAHARGSLAGISADQKHTVVFRGYSEVRGIGPVRHHAANGDVAIRPRERRVPAPRRAAHVGIPWRKVDDTLATVRVSISETSSSLRVYSRLIELTVERRGRAVSHANELVRDITRPVPRARRRVTRP